MSDLTEFLLARISEDEAAARAASPGPWHVDTESATVLAVDDIEVCDGFALSGPQLRATTRHIAHWDPARVLAECEAKRRIVTEVHHRAADGPRAEYLGNWQKDACEGCGWGGPCDDYWVEHINDCPTLRLLALPYADHTDYDEAWRP